MFHLLPVLLFSLSLLVSLSFSLFTFLLIIKCSVWWTVNQSCVQNCMCYETPVLIPHPAQVVSKELVHLYWNVIAKASEKSGQDFDCHFWHLKLDFRFQMDIFIPQNLLTSSCFVLFLCYVMHLKVQHYNMFLITISSQLLVLWNLTDGIS